MMQNICIYFVRQILSVVAQFKETYFKKKKKKEKYTLYSCFRIS